ncbi:MAG: hypothetical protein U0610_19430 [bacterium]
MGEWFERSRAHAWGRARRLARACALALAVGASGACGDSGGGGAAPDGPPPVARLRAPAYASPGVAISVDAFASGGTIERLVLDFDDGSRLVNPSHGFALHRFASPGDYTIRATLTGAGASSTAEATVRVVAEPGPTTRFDLPADKERPSWGEIPWPSDLFRDASGRVAVDGVNVANGIAKSVLEAGLNQLDGFGTTTAAYVWLDGDVDPASLPSTPEASTEYGSPIVLIDIEPSSPAYRTRVPVIATFDARDRRLSVLPRPGVPLRPKTRYGLVVRTDLWGTRAGAPAGSVRAPETLAALLGGATPGTPYGSAARAEVELLRAALASEPDFPAADVSGVAAATVFTTQHIEDDLLEIRNALERGDSGVPDPAPRFDPQWIFGAGGRASLDALIGPQPDSAPGLRPKAHQNVATIVTKAWFRTPIYLSPDPHFLDPYGGTFVVENGKPVVQRVVELPFSLALPSTPPPPNGYPVVIAQHGLGGERSSELLVIANTLCAEGFAIAAIDAVQHGDRYDLSSFSPALREVLDPVLRSIGFDLPAAAKDEAPNYAQSTLDGPDGWADANGDGATIGLVDALINLAGFRDNFRQNVVDHMSLARMLRTFDGEIPGVGRVRFDPDQLYYSGTSLGGILGANFVSYEPTVRAANLHNAGGGLGVNLLVNSPGIGGLFGPLLGVAFGIGSDGFSDPSSPLVNLAQTVIDGGDPINVARFALREPLTYASGPSQPRSVLLLEAMWDYLVPNVANEALARAFGLALLEPSYRPVEGVASGGPTIEGNVNGKTGALAQYSPAEHGTLYAYSPGGVYYEIGFPFATGERFRPLEHDFSVRQPVNAAITQIRDFFLGVRAGGAGTVEMKDGYAPLHDYDDDGFLDEDEMAAGTDPSDPSSHR